MATYVGLDWARRGWFGVVLRDSGEWDADLFPTIWSVWKEYSDAARIFVDIPMGLPSEERRACDAAAKEKLGAAQGSVFYTPVRAAVYEQNLDDAKAINEEAGFSIQNQAWSIVPRIREVDEFLDSYPTACDRLFETHPEVCFAALNGGHPPEHSKHTDRGRRERLSLLDAEHDGATAIYERCVATFTEPEYGPLVSDEADIVDALAAAVTARRDPDRTEGIPPSPPEDERGIPMQIRYPSATRQTRLTDLDG